MISAFRHLLQSEQVDDLKVKKLPTLLESEALAIWLEMTEAEKVSYKESKVDCTDGPHEVRFSGRLPCQIVSPRGVTLGIPP